MEAELTKLAVSGLAMLRAPFPENQVSQLPKGTKAQNECPPNEKRNCEVCGGWHHPKINHLSYVGHAALTDRLLDADPNWTWEPLAYDPMGLPLFDSSGGLWIKLTVCGVTRLGYGHAAEKKFQDPGNREKEVIGDALRNAGMRFGAALDLWHKGDLHAAKESAQEEVVQGHFVEEEPKQLPAAAKKVASAPKASTAPAVAKPAAAVQPTLPSVEPSVATTEPVKQKTAEIPEHDADKLKELITSGMKQLGWKMIKLREFYEQHVDPEPFASADTMPLEKMRLLHAKLVEKQGVAPF